MIAGTMCALLAMLTPAGCERSAPTPSNGKRSEAPTAPSPALAASEPLASPADDPSSPASQTDGPVHDPVQDLAPGNLTTLGPSLEPLRARFNAGKDRARLVALLSPTCPICTHGAWSLRQQVMEAFPNADLDVSIVWMDMLPTDDRQEAETSSQIIQGPNVQQFYDTDAVSGETFARVLGCPPSGPAWDVYLFYEPGATWADAPPAPMRWMHQMDNLASHQNHFTGKALSEAFRRTMVDLGAASAAGDRP